MRGSRDNAIDKLRAALQSYERAFPGAKASVYRQSPASIRIRIVGRHFEGMPRSRRHDEAWRFLQHIVGEDIMGEVSMLLVLPPSELRSSLSNLEFEDPIPSRA